MRPSHTPHVFITGSGFSGSTLLDLLISSHPALTSVGEINHLERWIHQKKTCACGNPIYTCEFWLGVGEIIYKKYEVDIFETPQLFPISIMSDRSTLNGFLTHYQRLFLAAAAPSPLTKIDLFKTGNFSTNRIIQNRLALFDAVNQIADTKAVVDSSKRPTTMKWIWHYNPAKLKVVYLVRDGRGVMASNMKRGKSVNNAAKSWVRNHRIVQLMLKRIPRDSWFFVKYEAICETPEKIMREVFEFLGLEAFNAVEYFRGKELHSIGGNPMKFRNDDTKILLREGWREKLSEDDKNFFEKIGGKMNKKLGYED